MDTVSQAKEVLLRALGEIDSSVEDLDEGEAEPYCYLTVVYSVIRRLPEGKSHEIGGWCSTSEPSWATQRQLEIAAEKIGSGYVSEQRNDDADDK